MVTVLCPECHVSIKLEPNPEIGQRVTCQSCHTDLEVTWLFPVSLDLLETEKLNPDYPEKDQSLN